MNISHCMFHCKTRSNRVGLSVC